MDSKQSYITIVYEDELISIPVEAVSADLYTVSLDFLQSFFPSVTAPYTENGEEVKGMMIKNGCIQIQDLKLVYKTRFHKGNFILVV